PAVTVPPLRLRAHDCGEPFACTRVQLGEGLSELIRRHVVGIAAERSVLPPGIYGNRRRLTEAAQRLRVHIVHAVPGERLTQHLSVKVRVPARPGKRTHIDELRDLRALQQRYEFIQGSRGVPDGEDLTRRGRCHSAPSTTRRTS